MFTEFYVKTKLALESYKNDERGVTAIEYGLIAAGIAIVIIVGVDKVGSNLSGLFEKVATEIGTHTAPGG